ncbi:hypothetical protein MY04_1974 [Flammeovirga sp. MY04]|uniref:hypothetical protein n=1 Tax=Flammeovirga sp. MY04 TaxID=1191459 RepID=UPI0008062329|nr:hypothetical protein [Flammeovirga sp. MY04]ANQ49348.1 hypothetical protein MY04_1974 [Flammeovirga sp. MY04]
MKTTIYTLLLSMVCLLFGSCDSEESKLTSCDHSNIGERYQYYSDVFLEALAKSDCEAINEQSEDALEFINANQNCLVIYMVLQEGNNVNDEKEANLIIEDMKSQIQTIQYSCEVENLPVRR